VLPLFFFDHHLRSRLDAAMMYGFTRSLKNEIVRLAPGARVNCVAPGWTRTPMAAAALADPKVVYQALATCVPLSWLDERELMQTRAARR
jgi:NAD(P)-dependent dehydrogenase (short-subunit alcohol dehydrogenase family)